MAALAQGDLDSDKGVLLFEFAVVAVPSSPIPPSAGVPSHKYAERARTTFMCVLLSPCPSILVQGVQSYVEVCTD